MKLVNKMTVERTVNKSEIVKYINIYNQATKMRNNFLDMKVYVSKMSTDSECEDRWTIEAKLYPEEREKLLKLIERSMG